MKQYFKNKSSKLCRANNYWRVLPSSLTIIFPIESPFLLKPFRKAFAPPEYLNALKMKQLEEPRKEIVLDTAKTQLEQQKQIEKEKSNKPKSSVFLIRKSYPNKNHQILLIIHMGFCTLYEQRLDSR